MSAVRSAALEPRIARSGSLRPAPVGLLHPGIEEGQATEALLSEVAVALLRLPFEERTRGLHIRALQLKRRLDQWGPSMPTDDERRATRESILALRSEAASCLAPAR
jgi:hypothetical protein